MRFAYTVEVEVKNDGVTQDTGRFDLGMILQDRIGETLIELPWVIALHIEPESANNADTR